MLYRRKRRKKLNRACMDTAAAGMEKMLAQENAEDILSEAKQINEKRYEKENSVEEAEEAEETTEATEA